MFRFFVPLTILLTFIRVLKNGVLAGRLIIEGTYMKYKYILLIGFLLITGIITSAVANEADWMPDANLRSEVRSDMGLTDGEALTRAELAQLTVLTAQSANIASLTGLEFATGLQTLHIWKNRFTDLSPLSGLTALTELKCGNNKNLTDISPLSTITSLTTLALKNSNISDVSPLGTLTNLTWLRLSGNPISNIASISNLHGIDTDVDIPAPPPGIQPSPVAQQAGNNNNITPVSDRTQQVRDAIVRAVPGINSADDVTAAHLASITELDLGYRQITTLQDGDFDGLTALTKLWLSVNRISDISPLAELAALTTLSLSSNRISDISALEDLTSLTQLSLRNNSISDISPLEDLTSLTTLILSRNRIRDISALEDLTSLTTLILSSNRISDISALEDLTSLTTLSGSCKK